MTFFIKKEKDKKIINISLKKLKKTLIEMFFAVCVSLVTITTTNIIA